MTDEGRLKYIAELDVEALNRAAERVNDRFVDMGQTAEREGNKIDAVMKRVGGAIAGYFSFQAAEEFTRKLVGVRSQIESLEISFTTLLGSEQAAAKLFGEIREFAVSTPLQLGDLAGAAQTLLAFNIEAEKVMPTLKAIGDISMGDSQKLQSLTLAFAQASSAGKLMGQDLLQMINAGFNPLGEISRKTGKSIGELKEEMSNGAITADMLADAFMSATEEGGKFYGMLEKQSKGIAGSLSNLKGAIDDLLNEIGSAGQETFVNTVNAITNMVKSYKEIARTLADIAIVYGTAKAALIAYNTAAAIAKVTAEGQTLAQLAQLKATSLLEAAQKKLNATILANPYALAAAAIAAMVVGMTRLYKKSQEVERKQKEFNDTLAKHQTEISGATKELDTLVERLQKAKKGTDEYKGALQDLQDRYGEYLENLNIEAQTLATTAENQQKLRDAIVETTKARAKDAMLSSATSDYNETVDKFNQGIIKRLEKLYGNPDQYAGVYARIQEMIGKGAYLSMEEGITKIFGNVNKEGVRGVRRVDVISDINAIIKATKEFQQQQNAILNAFGSGSTLSNKTDDTAKVEQMSEEERKMAEQRRKERQKIIDQALKDIENGRKQIEQYDADLKLDIRQAMNDALDDGFTKTVNQLGIDFDNAILKLEAKKKDILAKRQEVLNAEARATTGNGEATGAVAQLTAEEAAYFDQQTKLLTQKRKAAEKAISDAILAQYRTYEQERTAILEDYERKRKDLQAAGGTEDNLKELNRQQQNALKQLDKQIASRSATYNAWLERISVMSLQELEKTLTEAQARLTEAEAAGEVGEDMAVKRAQVDALIERIRELQAKLDVINRGKGLDALRNKWALVSDSIRMADDALLQMIGDTGVLNDEVMNVLNVFLSGVEMIANDAIAQKLEQTAGQLADTADEVANNFENVSSLVDLIIAAVTSLVKLFVWLGKINTSNTREDWQKFIDQEAQTVNTLLNRLENWDFYEAIGYRSNLSTDFLYEDLAQWLEAHYTAKLKAIEGMNDTLADDRWMRVWIREGEEIDHLLGSITSGMSKIYGDAKLDSLNRQMQALRDSIQESLDLAVQYRKEAAETRNKEKKDLLNSEADAAAENAEKTLKELLELMENTVDAIIGTADSIAKELSSALETAFQNGTDAAKAWSDEVNKLVKNIVTQLLIDQYLTPKIQEIINGLGIIDENGNLQSTDYILSQMDRFRSELNGLMEGWREVYTAIRDQFDFDDRSATQGGFAQASQESIDELSGRASAIQGHTAIISENMHLLVSNSNAILNSIRNIETTVSGMSIRLNDMADEIEIINNKL